MTKQGPHGIAWTDYSWPIVNGCRRVSEGCRNCYAERLTATRLAHTPKYEGLARMTASGPQWTGKTRLWEPELAAPLKVKKPSRIFVADMGDLFYEGVSDEDIDRVFAVMALASRHTFQVLTKRPERMRQYFNGGADLYIRLCVAARKLRDEPWLHEDEPFPWPLPHCWLGVSVEDQATADQRIPLLLQTPAAVRFVSYEPALSAVDFSGKGWIGCFHATGTQQNDHSRCAPTLDWIIVGGESGPQARPFDLAWARQMVAQCKAAGCACFYKQGGSSNPCLHDRKGGHFDCFPEDLKVREFPDAL